MKKVKFIAIAIVLVIVSCAVHRHSKTYLIAKNEAEYALLKHMPVFVDEKDVRTAINHGYFNCMDCSYPNIHLENDSISTSRYFDYFTHVFRRFDLTNWQRDTTNMLFVHNAIKNIGYKNFINNSEFNMKFELGWEKYYSISNYIDSLIFHFNAPVSDTSNYYYKFWQRRKIDRNENTLICILKEIKEIYSDDASDCTVSNFENDTISTLMKYDYQIGHIDISDGKSIRLVYSYFDYLKSLGLEISAFNLIHHIHSLDSLDINRDSLLLTLELDTVSRKVWYDLYNWEGQGNWIYKKFYWGP